MSCLCVIIGGIVLVLLVVVVLIVVMVYVIWDCVVSVEQQCLCDIVDCILCCFDLFYQEVLVVLKFVEVGVYVFCSFEYIWCMQILVMIILLIDQMGYFEGGKLCCIFWGLFLLDVDQFRLDYVISDGVGIVVDVCLEISG